MTIDEEILRALRADVRTLQETQIRLEQVISDLKHADDKQETLTARILVDLGSISHVLKGEDGKESLIMRFALAERMMHESAATLKEMTEESTLRRRDEASRRWDIAKGIGIGVALLLAGALLKWILEGPK